MECTGTEVYSEAGLVSESEFQRLVGCDPKTVGVKAVREENPKKKDSAEKFKVMNEEGQEQRLFLISLAGLSCGDVHSIKKVRIFWRVELQNQEHLMQASRQLSAAEPQRMYAFHRQDMLHSMPFGLRASGKLQLETVQSLKERFSSIQSQRKSREQDNDEEADSDSMDETPDKRGVVAPRVARSRFARAAPSEKTSNAATAKKRAAKAKSAKSADDADEDCFLANEGEISSLSLDSDMLNVAKVCKGYPNKIPQCLVHLSVQRILSGEKLGRSIAKAGIGKFFRSQTRFCDMRYR